MEVSAAKKLRVGGKAAEVVNLKVVKAGTVVARWSKEALGLNVDCSVNCFEHGNTIEGRIATTVQ